MKKITITFFLGMILFSSFAQAPQAFNYQAMARDNAGNVLANQNVSFKIVIEKESINGPVVFREVHDTITNEMGLVNLAIGLGTVISGVFEEINWGDALYFLKIWMDPNGGIDFQYMGTSQLLSVPYSLYSASTGDTTRWKKNNDDLYYNNGNIGIGTTSQALKITSPLESFPDLLGRTDTLHHQQFHPMNRN